MNLSGKTLPVTGRRVRLGRVMSMAIAGAEGDVVLLNNSSRKPAEKLKTEIKNKGQNACMR